MSKVVGALLVGFGCSYLGFMQALVLKKAERLTAEWIQVVEYMKREITDKHITLTDILNTVKKSPWVNVGLFAEKLLERLKTHDMERFREIWRTSLEDANISAELVEIILPLGAVLGQYEATKQGEALEYTLQLLKERKQWQGLEHARLSKVYGAIGVTSGLFWVILLL